MLMPARSRTLAVAAVLLCATSGPALAQELATHLAVYDVTTGRAPAGFSPPQIRGTYVFRLQAQCNGGLKFEQRLQFEARGPGGVTEIDQTSLGEEAKDGRRYQFNHRATVDGKPQPDVRGEVDVSADGEGQARFSRPAGRVVALPAGTMFPIAVLRRMVKAARDGETGFEGKFFMGDKPEPAQAVSVLLGKPPRRVNELPPAQGDRGLINGHDRFYFRASFYDDEKGTGEPLHEMSSVTLDNGVEIWGTHEQGELRLEYRLIRIEALPRPDC